MGYPTIVFLIMQYEPLLMGCRWDEVTQHEDEEHKEALLRSVRRHVSTIMHTLIADLHCTPHHHAKVPNQSQAETSLF